MFCSLWYLKILCSKLEAIDDGAKHFASSIRTFNSNLKNSKTKFLEIHSSKFIIIYTKGHSSYIYDGWLFCYDQIGPTDIPRAIHHIINYL